jgi:hypothetical protein
MDEVQNNESSDIRLSLKKFREESKLPVVSCECEKWRIIVMEECRLRSYENKV